MKNSAKKKIIQEQLQPRDPKRGRQNEEDLGGGQKQQEGKQHDDDAQKEPEKNRIKAAQTSQLHPEQQQQQQPEVKRAKVEDVTSVVNPLRSKLDAIMAAEAAATSKQAADVAKPEVVKQKPKSTGSDDSQSIVKRAGAISVIEELIKGFLKPFYAKGVISKESYKIIMRKCVEKVYASSKNHDIVTSKVKRLVEGYVEKYS